MIKNIVIDLGGVIVKLDREKCVESFRKIGYVDFEKILNNYLQEGFFLEFEKGIISEVEFKDIICTNIGKNVADQKIDKSIGDFLTEISNEKFYALKELKKRFKLYLLSNTNPVAVRKVDYLFRMSGSGFEDFFDKTFLSYQMKMVKPDKEIFQEVLKSAQINASETLFIDDSIANLEFAGSLGFKTLHLTYESDLLKSVISFV